MTSSSSASVNTSTQKNIYSDFNINGNGDIRYVKNKYNYTYTVLELHNFLQELSDRVCADSNHVLNIAHETPSIRHTDNMIRLLGKYNIDDETSEYLYDGTLIQGEGDNEEVYSGIVVIGSVNSPDTDIGFIQKIKEVPICTRYLTAGFNGDISNGILLRCLLKTKKDGKFIDGGKVITRARCVGDTFDESKLLANHYGQIAAAIFTSKDLYYDEIMNNGVYIDELSGFSGTNYPLGSPLLPVNNYEDARKIAERYGIKIPVKGFITLDDVLI